MKTLQEIFPFSPTQNQSLAIKKLEGFTGFQGKSPLFILKGFAGTGKTTLIAAYITWLHQLKINVVLCAPTGRAAKVLSKYSKTSAFTIHKQIYYQANVNGSIVFSVQKNKYKNTVFIVDEASMISDTGGLGSSFISKGRTLLDDLIDYVYSSPTCKLILIGDTAQLPPVGSDQSPALDSTYLSAKYPLNIGEIELTEVTRQSESSGILFNATKVRVALGEKEVVKPKFYLEEYQDIVRLNGYEIEEELSSCYSNSGIENTIIICRSNKQANNFNKYIKYSVLYQEDELNAGDLLMVVRNNYYWLQEEVDVDFIANGDMAEVMRVIGYEDRFGFRFADVSLRLLDYKKDVEFEVKLLLNTLTSESPSLGREDGARLYEAVWDHYSDERNKMKRKKLLKADPYFNALQVKFGYAITCHKSQGGQWENVFVDQGYLTDEMIDKSYLRWLYTAITRATSKLYLTNFIDEFFVE